MKDLSVLIVGGGSGLGALLARMAIEDGASKLAIVDIDRGSSRNGAGDGAGERFADRLGAMRHPAGGRVPCGIRRGGLEARPHRHADQLRGNLSAPADSRDHRRGMGCLERRQHQGNLPYDGRGCPTHADAGAEGASQGAHRQFDVGGRFQGASARTPITRRRRPRWSASPVRSRITWPRTAFS